ncbi:hypothetical protein HFP51_05805 [Parasphingopyxis sp. CP4]|uniref:hypothetical protein n=1 Tax=Parasphingopyxis sp. CP4 TaxID=2724527 RepID=UPI0015A2FD76|nr:hypothetical protein [Parasphingopyxis sp. CP4]QLC21732.1 hypothetical protein HFP51_05805 [Parasphingopyxis sp. CP4]
MCLPAIFTEKGWKRWAEDNPNTRSEMIQRLAQLAPEWNDVERRLSGMDDLLATLEDLNGDKRAFGFKQHFGKPGRSSTQQIIDLKLPTLILDRSNVLACYSSSKIAKKTGQGSLIDPAKRRRAKVDFVPDEFSLFLARRRKIDKHWNGELEKTGVDTMTLEYNEARTLAGMERVAEFLGQEAGKFGDWGTAKRNSNNILSRFSNPDNAEAYLEAHDLMDWAEEN